MLPYYCCKRSGRNKDFPDHGSGTAFHRNRAALRLSAQQGNAFYTSRADFVVENRGEENLRDAVSKIFEELQGDSDTL